MSSHSDSELDDIPPLPSQDARPSVMVLLPGYPAPREPPSNTAMFSFIRAPHGGWHVFEDNADGTPNLVYDILHSPATPDDPYERFKLHDGEDGPLLASLMDQTLTVGSFVTKMVRRSPHNYKWSFRDQQRREYAFREEDRDRLIIYPTKKVVAEGNVTSTSGKGRFKVTDRKNAPDIPVLMALYCGVLQKQEEALRLGFSGSSHPGTRMRSSTSRS